MTKHSDQHGFSAIEVLLVVVIVGIIAAVGFFVYHSTQKSNDALNAANKTSSEQSPAFKNDTTSKSEPANTSPTSSADLNNDLSGVTSANTQSNSDISGGTSAVNDQSTFTTSP